MRNIRQIIIILIFIFGNQLHPQVWTPKENIPTKRWYPGVAELDGKIYVTGGQGEYAPYPSLSNLEVYDPSVDSWQVLSPMQTGRWGVMLVAYNNKIFAIGGLTGSFQNGFISTNIVEEYDPATNTWQTKNPLQTERGYGGAVVINDTIFVFGGYRHQSGQDLSTVEKYYPPTDTWITEAFTMPSNRSTFMTAKVYDNVYFIGGWNSEIVEAYNYSTGEWTTKASLPVATGGGGVVVDDSLIYIIGGRGGDFNEFQCYNTIADVWNLLRPMPTPREGLAAAIVDDKVYTITGSAPSGFPFYNTNEEARNIVSGVKADFENPLDFVLYQNYPNPFNPETIIEYYLDKPAKIMLKIYDSLGREIKTLVNQEQTTGLKTAVWNGTNEAGNSVVSGIYFYRLQTEIEVIIKKMVLMH